MANRKEKIIKPFLEKIATTLIVLFVVIPYTAIMILHGIWTGKLNLDSTIGNTFNYVLRKK